KGGRGFLSPDLVGGVLLVRGSIRHTGFSLPGKHNCGVAAPHGTTWRHVVPADFSLSTCRLRLRPIPEAVPQFPEGLTRRDDIAWAGDFDSGQPIKCLGMVGRSQLDRECDGRGGFVGCRPVARAQRMVDAALDKLAGIDVTEAAR